MPKNWAAQKGNLKHLYIDEDRPLEEVREILRERYGFSASIRSYRTKIDEWSLRKYKSKKLMIDRKKLGQERTINRDANLTSSARSLTSSDEEEQTQLLSQFSIPPRAFESLEFRFPALLDNDAAKPFAIEMLLRQCLQRPDYFELMKTYLSDGECCQTLMEMKDRGQNLFQLIKQNVPADRGEELTKLVLDADISVQHQLRDRMSPWAIAWHKAYSEPDFSSALSRCLRSDIVPVGAIHNYQHSAIVTVAEHRLKRLWRDFQTAKSKDRLNCAEIEAAQKCCREYLEILHCCESYFCTLQSCWYKNAVSITVWSEPERFKIPASNPQPPQDRVMVRSIQKLQNISDTYDSVGRGNFTLNSWDFQFPEFVSRDDHPSDRFHDMLKNWRAGNGVQDYVKTILQSRNTTKVTTFQTLLAGEQNLFDLICKKANEAEHVSLIKDFLRIFSESYPGESVPQYTCWRSAFIESDWARFKRAIGLVKLNGCMSRKSAELVFRATFLLVGERLIDAYKTRFDLQDSLGSGNTEYTVKHVQRYLESPAYFRDREQYDTLLKDFRLRCVNHWEI